MLQAIRATRLGYGTYDVEVFPQTPKDRMTAGRERGHLRVNGEPRQANPFEKLGYENVEKTILVDQFVAMTHFLYRKKRPFDRLMATAAVRANLARKDF